MLSGQPDAGQLTSMMINLADNTRPCEVLAASGFESKGREEGLYSTSGSV
jgi:hypothetical protein